MPEQQRRAVWWLGLAQCVLWGVLYYGFSVLLVPMEQAFGLPRTVVAGAFSLALLAMALGAPAIGRRLDAGQTRGLLRAGAGLALSGLALIASGQHLFVLYAGWLLVGMAMSMLLYEPAFALVTRAVADQGHRLRALAAVTVLGGLASTIFLPLLAGLIEHGGWRCAVFACMVAVTASAWILEMRVLPALPALPVVHGAAPAPIAVERRRWPAHLPALMLIFATGTLAGMALTTLLIPLLMARGAPASSAAWVLAALGVAQLPGRIWLLRAGPSAPPAGLHLLPILCQALGLVAIGFAPSLAWSALAVAVFGFGAGLQTLLRPWLVQRLFGEAEAGRWNGEVARMQGFARAGGPIAAAGAAWLGGTPLVLAGCGGLLLLTALLARRLPV